MKIKTKTVKTVQDEEELKKIFNFLVSYFKADLYTSLFQGETNKDEEIDMYMSAKNDSLIVRYDITLSDDKKIILYYVSYFFGEEKFVDFGSALRLQLCDDGAFVCVDNDDLIKPHKSIKSYLEFFEMDSSFFGCLSKEEQGKIKKEMEMLRLIYKI